jgi:hypothetical protein
VKNRLAPLSTGGSPNEGVFGIASDAQVAKINTVQGVSHGRQGTDKEDYGRGQGREVEGGVACFGGGEE